MNPFIQPKPSVMKSKPHAEPERVEKPDGDKDNLKKLLIKPRRKRR